VSDEETDFGGCTEETIAWYHEGRKKRKMCEDVVKATKIEEMTWRQRAKLYLKEVSCSHMISIRRRTKRRNMVNLGRKYSCLLLGRSHRSISRIYN